jgi:hypothetical protein
MASRTDLARAGDLEAVLVVPWVPWSWLMRVRIPLAIVVAAALALFPLTFSGVSPVFSVPVVAVIVAAVIVIVSAYLAAKAGTRLIGYSPRGVFAPELVPWPSLAGVTAGRTTTAGRAVGVDRADGASLEVAIPDTVTEEEYRAFLTALRAEAQRHGIPFR